MTRIGVALFNFQNGGMVARGQYRFGPLQYAFNNVETCPALILFCEAKYYLDDGYHGLFAAAEALSDELGQPYNPLLGSLSRGPMPPAIFYNPDVLVPRQWFDGRDPHAFEADLNVAWFALRQSGAVAEMRTVFGTWVQHCHNASGVIRRIETARMDRFGEYQLPIIGGGDFNSTASGSHWPQLDWARAGTRVRSHKGRLIGGTWTADTAALDLLIGWWNSATGHREGGCGYAAVAELAWRDGVPGSMEPTVNPNVLKGGSLLIDLLVANQAMVPHVLTDTYRVHVPDPGAPYPSDHRLVTVDVEL